MAAFDPGDIAVGGVHEYIEIKHSDTSHAQMIQVDDLLTDSGPQTFVTGLTFRPPTGELFSTSTPNLTQDNTPHDVDWIPDDSGLLVAVVPSSGVLKLRKYDFDGVQLDEWDLAIEAGWGQQLVRISVACDSRTVFYTMSLKSVKRFDIVDEVQLADYDTLPADSPYIYGAIRVLPGEAGDDRDIIAPMTLAGNGPQRAICLDSDRASLWTDELEPPGGTYHIIKWRLSDRTQLASVVTQADAGSTNDYTLSLACYFNFCVRRRFIGFTSVNG